MNNIADKLKLLPDSAGVYVMLDDSGQIIYVGKAKVLKNRVRQYFRGGEKTEKVAAMVKNIADFYYYVTPTEIDALSLENNLIKKYKPRYNILLKDDKTYPYLAINLSERYPTFRITRKIKKDKEKYFGPFMGGVNAKNLLEIINLLFTLRPCDKKLNKLKQLKPCLNYHLKRCDAPCANLIDEQEYLKRVDAAIAFLSGDISDAKDLITAKMLAAAEKEDFELAQKYKEFLGGLGKIGITRLTALNRFIDADVIACVDNGIYSAINVLIVRRGRMLGGKNYSFESAAISRSETIREFIASYYLDKQDIPSEVIIKENIEDCEPLRTFIKEKTGKNVVITAAKQGVKRQLADMAEDNAKEHLDTAIDRIKHKNDMTIIACKSLQKKLSLQNYPRRMECYDISNISGVDKVGSMVVFIDGTAERAQYRRFKIKTFEGADDFRSLQEVLLRRLERMKSDPDKFEKPNLIIIDGGKGQLSSVKEIFDKENVTDIDLISLAKREEEVFLPNKPKSIILDKSDYCLRMLQRIRDEAHRFAITYHRTLRGARALSSVLDGVKGLGKVKKKALLEQFKDIAGIASATKEDLKKVEGIGDKQAENIIETLTKEGLK